MKTYPDTSAESREPEELEICISCAHPNSPGTHFCEHCRTPLSSYAATGPFECLFAEGDLWRKAVHHQRWGKSIRLFLVGYLLLVLLSFVLGSTGLR